MKVLVAIGGVLDSYRIVGVYPDSDVEAAKAACEAHAASPDRWNDHGPWTWELRDDLDRWNVLWSGHGEYTEYHLEPHELGGGTNG